MMTTTNSLKLFAFCLLIGCITSVGCNIEQDVAESTEPAADMEAQQALAGVGIGGQKFKNDSDFDKIMTGPISTLKHIQQLAPLEIQIPHALNLFQATNGRLPKNHAEFMTEIIEFNKINLPELPPGHVYHYNKEAGQLWVYPEAEVPQD